MTVAEEPTRDAAPAMGPDDLVVTSTFGGGFHVVTLAGVVLITGLRTASDAIDVARAGAVRARVWLRTTDRVDLVAESTCAVSAGCQEL